MKQLFTAVLCLTFTSAYAAIRTVPGEVPTIQAGIDASQQGDTVLVFPGTYFENINFHGKNIVVTSRFFENNEMHYIAETIIDGSQPNHPDTASCVLIVSGENASAVLQGFTLTGGGGTRWIDEHGAGTYREGGGILVTLSSPTIRYNYIVNNNVLNMDNVQSTGGGGIRIGDGGCIVENNVITLNRGMYGGGIVLNYCAGTVIRNNMILENFVEQYSAVKPGYGGGGIWVGSPKQGDPSPNIIENNTIYGNHALDEPTLSFAGGRGGAIVIHSNAKAVVRNNIVWENHSSYPISPIAVLNSSATVEYNDVSGGYPGTGNIDSDPDFSDSSFFLTPASPGVDAGDTAAVYSDPAVTAGSMTAQFPSQGSIRNDLGAYGGQRRNYFVPFSRSSISIPLTAIAFGYALPGDSISKEFIVSNRGSKNLRIDSVRFTAPQFYFHDPIQSLELNVNSSLSLQVLWKPDQQIKYADTLFIYHNSSYTENPQKVILQGNAIPTAHMSVDLSDHNFGNIDINTAEKDTTIFIHNSGTSGDSIHVSVNPTGVNPSSAVAVFPAAFSLQPGDSQGVTFSIHPNKIIKSLSGIYSPKISFKSFLSEDTTAMWKIMRFKLTGTLGAGPDEYVPGKFSLDQNFPNPFNPSTSFTYALPIRSVVTVQIYDIMGREISTIVSEEQPAGRYTVKFDGSHLSSGIYFYQLSAGSNSSIKKMVLMK